MEATAMEGRFMKKTKPGLKEKLRYQFDNIMSKGTIALVALLFLITAFVVIITGILAAFMNKDSTLGVLIWQSLMHALDAGTLAGDDTKSIGYIILMSLVTICGIFVTSILIGIISTGFEQKLNDLRKGTSKVLESGHTVIIGFNDSIYTLLSELICAGENQKYNCIVVLGEEDKEVMEDMIKGHIEDFKTTRIICKSGKLTESYILERASLETSKSIIINQEDDFNVIKVILAVVNYLKSVKAFDSDLHITSMIHKKENLDAAKIAGEGKAEILFFEDALSRIIAHTCRQPGLSLVLTEFFDFEGDEFYFENFTELSGKTFGEILNLFEGSTVVGLEQDGRVMLNPPMDTVLKAENHVIHLAKDDYTSKPESHSPKIDLSVENSNQVVEQEDNHLLILGCNRYLSDILAELDNYADKGTIISVAGEDILEFVLTNPYENITVTKQECDIYNRSNLEELVKDRVENILILSDLESGNEEADAKTLLLLIQLRDIEKKWNQEFNITSEMRTVSNQKLAKVANVNDFVVGSTITNLIISQVSENRKLSLLFEDLLDADGSELYMKKAERYVKTGTETDFYCLTEIARQRNEIVIGYKKVTPEGIVVVTNPMKSTRISFSKEDYLIVIAEDNK
jgi:Trk K+ transport system NAD-binding subunit